MAEPTKVTVTGAAGAIGYAILFRIACGQMLGPDTKVHLTLLEIPDAVKAAEGTAMELDDCAFPLLSGIDITDDARRPRSTASNVALLVGARPRSKGMERADLLEANGGIFKPQGEAINAGAADDVKILVVGNPANTNALIAQSNAPDVPRERFTAMTRLDHNRAIAQLAKKTGRGGRRHHQHGRVGQPLTHDVPRPVQREGGWQERRRGASTTRSGTRTTSSPRVGKRGAAIIEARGASSARPRPPTPPSTTSTTGSNGTRDGDWVSMAVPSDGSYGVDEGLISSFPCTCANGEWSIVQGLEVNDFAQEKIEATVNELREERDAVAKLDLI